MQAAWLNASESDGVDWANSKEKGRVDNCQNDF